MLNICPLLNMDVEGHLAPREKLRGKRRVIQRVVEKMEAHAEGGLEYSGKCVICHSLCMEDARTVADLVEARFPKLQGMVEIFPIGTTIGSHEQLKKCGVDYFDYYLLHTLKKELYTKTKEYEKQRTVGKRRSA